MEERSVSGNTLSVADVAPGFFPLLDLPLPPVSLRRDGEKFRYWDPWRRKWLIMSPEEWVRQHVAHYLLQLGFPPGAIAIEKKGQLRNGRRLDVLAMGPDGRPLVLTECKAPDQKIGVPALLQAGAYRRHYPSPYVWLTNGRQHVLLFCPAGGTGVVQIPALPPYAELVASLS
jgi:hypothetical protein